MSHSRAKLNALGRHLAVLPTDVVDVREESLHRCQPSELAVGTAVIVGMDEAWERDGLGAVARVPAGVGPLAQRDATAASTLPFQRGV